MIGRKILSAQSMKKVTVVCSNCRDISLLHGSVNYLHLYYEICRNPWQTRSQVNAGKALGRPNWPWMRYLRLSKFQRNLGRETKIWSRSLPTSSKHMIKWTELWLDIMREFGISGRLVSLLEITVQNTLACDKIQTEVGHFFEVNRGLNQGDGDGRTPF